MKENQTYSIHSQDSSNPHHVRKDDPDPKSTPPPKPVAQPAAHPTDQPSSVQQHTIPAPSHESKSDSTEEKTSKDSEHDRDKAVALARAKIAAIHGEVVVETSKPEPPQPETRPAPPVAPSAHQTAKPKNKKTSSKPSHKKPQHALDADAVLNEERAFSIQNLRRKFVTDSNENHEQPRRKPWYRRYALSIIVFVGLLLLFNNQLVYGQISYYVTPGSRIETPTIIEATASQTAPPGQRILIPKINVDVPVNYDVGSREEDAIQAGLENGVVHYYKTGLPGEIGNNVLFGHNTNNFWYSGNYKTAFVLLDRLEAGDRFELHYHKKRFVYEIYKKKVIEKDDFSPVTEKVTEPIVTLITCHPPGTSWRRLIVQARQISPVPVRSDTATGNDIPNGAQTIVPSNSDSVWEGLFGWLF